MTLKLDHDHSTAYFQTNARHQTPEWQRRLRSHVRQDHGSGNDWASIVEVDLIAEQHNLDHGRDAHGVEF